MALETGEKVSDWNPEFNECGRMDGEKTLGGDEALERSVNLDVQNRTFHVKELCCLWFLSTYHGPF